MAYLAIGIAAPVLVNTLALSRPCPECSLLPIWKSKFKVPRQLMGLGLSKDQQIAVVAEGSDAEAALEAIGLALASGLGEAVA